MLRGYILPFLKFLLWVAGFLLVVGGVLHYFFVERVQITHSAMAPTLLYGEQALLWKDAELEWGDIAVCEHPANPGVWVVGRVVGTPGTELQSGSGGRFLVDGRSIERDYKGEVEFYDPLEDRNERMRYGTQKFGDYADYEFFERKKGRFTMRPTKVRDGIFLLSDNLTAVGHDSRYFGEVDPAKCRGQIFMRWKPAEEDFGLGHGYLDWLL